MKDGLAIDYIKDQDNDICIEAIKQNPSALMYISDKRSEYKVLAVKTCLKHIKKDINYINEISDKVLKMVVVKLLSKKGKE